MIGANPTLQDIILQELPEPVNLQCNEDIDYDKLDSNEDVTQNQSTQSTGLYQVLSQCDTCDRDIKLLVRCTEEDVEDLYDLLTGTLQIVCPYCARCVNP
ncbi:early protein E7 [Saimiri sciureus papillomavirus 2]|uniref:Protein E7 n=1 Tax=Saimiri sciureus papillomavirus 2 TaxID=990305 RepID=W5QK94_9PAPI|nr:early protein E7 [Saimiri sciureus papillomavirus 2]